MHRWVPWICEQVDGKTVKRPDIGNWTNPVCWRSYDGAKELADRSRGAGAGFVLNDFNLGEPVLHHFLDFDYVWSESGEVLKPEVLELVQEIDSYTEVSSS